MSLLNSLARGKDICKSRTCKPYRFLNAERYTDILDWGFGEHLMYGLTALVKTELIFL